MEDQGIMALPGMGMQAPTAQPDFAQGLAAIEASRDTVSPDQFTQQSLEALTESDPQAGQQFIDAIANLNLPPEIIDALGQMVDAILAEPEKYQEIRAEFIREGVPEEILPPEFDPAYFGAMNLALDKLSMSAAPQQFAAGGIAQLTPVASGIASMGRNGDTMLAHITPAEARMLRRRGGSGTINPRTGLPEFFLKQVAKAVGSAFKSVGKAVSSVVKGVGNAIKSVASSTVGRIVLTAAAIYFGGPMVSSWLTANAPALAAYSTGITSALVNTGFGLASGQSFKDSLKQGVVAGVTAQAIQFGADKLTGPSTSGVGGTSTTTAQQLGENVDLASINNVPTSPLALPSTEVPTVSQLATANAPTVGADQIIAYPGSQIGEGFNVASAPMTVSGATATDAGVPGLLSRTDMSINAPPPEITGDFSSPTSLTAQGGSTGMIVPGEMPLPEGIVLKDSTGFGIPPAQSPGFYQQVGQGDLVGAGKTAYQNVADFFNPQPDIASAYQKLGIPQNTPFQSLSEGTQKQVMSLAQPTFGMASRMAGVGLGIAGLSGAFTPKQPDRPGVAPTETGTDLLRRSPEIYGTTPGGANVTYASLPMGYGYTPSQRYSRPQFVFGNPYAQTRFFADGGIAALAPSRYNLGGYASGGMRRNFPRRIGQIAGPGTETSDSIPAMLSDGEFVMTAKAVRGAGSGSRREGAKRMYQMMRKFERKA